MQSEFIQWAMDHTELSMQLANILFEVTIMYFIYIYIYTHTHIYVYYTVWLLDESNSVFLVFVHLIFFIIG